MASAVAADTTRGNPIMKPAAGKTILKGLTTPKNAKIYIRRIEELIDTKVSLLSTSPDRKDTIMIKDPFKI